MSVVDEILEASRGYANTFDRGDLPMPPKRHLAVVTCMDARISAVAHFWVSTWAMPTSSATLAAEPPRPCGHS